MKLPPIIDLSAPKLTPHEAVEKTIAIKKKYQECLEATVRAGHTKDFDSAEWEKRALAAAHASSEKLKTSPHGAARAMYALQRCIGKLRNAEALADTHSKNAETAAAEVAVQAWDLEQARPRRRWRH